MPHSARPAAAHVRDDVRIDVTCGGAPFEMGQRQGRELRSQIVAADRAVDELAPFRVKRPWWLPYGLFRRAAEQRAEAFLSRALGDSAWRERLAGLAAGSGLPQRKLALLNALEPMLSSLGDVTETGALGGCTALAVRGARAAGGEPVVAKNFDYLPLVQPFYILRDCRPAQGRRTLEFTAAPLAGAVDGMNESGLVITYNYAFAVDGPAVAPTVSMRINEALAECDTVSEAAELLRSRPRWGAGLLMLADASGDIAALELSSTRAELRRPAPGEDVLTHSNCYLTDALRGVQLDSRAVYSQKAAAAVRGVRPLESPERRDSRMRELLSDGGPLGADELAHILSDHGVEGEGTADTICMHSEFWNTTATLHWFPRQRKVRVAYAPACGARYMEFRME